VGEQPDSRSIGPCSRQQFEVFRRSPVENQSLRRIVEVGKYHGIAGPGRTRPH
jgi:hypothetical protein